MNLATYVNGYIVSTVGEYWPDRTVREIHAEVHDKGWLLSNKHLLGDSWDAAFMKQFGFLEIGCDRTYETMVFFATKSSHKCCPYEIESGSEIDFGGYKDADAAATGHRKMVAKYQRRKCVRTK